MSVQMTVRVDDEAAAFVDELARAGEGSRAEVINRALRGEMRRRLAARDAEIYTAAVDLELDSDAYGDWVASNAASVLTELD